MLLRNSSLAAQGAERPFLAPTWLIALLATIVVIALVLLYPRTALEHRLAEAPDTKLSALYLANLLRSDPNNPQLRLLLARHQAKIGNLHEARLTLQPALDAHNPDLNRQALRVLWELNEREYRLLPEKASAAREEARAELVWQLQELAKFPMSIDELLDLARKAYQLKQPILGAQLVHQISHRLDDPVESAKLFERAAEEALASGDYRGSAELHLAARNNSSDPAQARRHFHAALRALQSGNQALEAIEMGEREIGALADDPGTLLLMTQLARAAGRPDIADRYVRKLLHISLMRRWQAIQIARAWGEGSFLKVAQQGAGSGSSLPFDDKIYTLGYEVFLENRKLEDAWLLASSAVRQSPNDIAWRQRLARVAEWTGRPQVALENWLKVAQASQSDEAWQAVLRLAPGLFDDAALIPALHNQLARQSHDMRLIRELVAAYERQGDPRSAIAFLERSTRHNPRPETLELLAEIAERVGQTDLALSTWERLFADPQQLTAKRALRLAIMLLGQGRGAEGLAWLERAQARAGLANNDDADYWRLTGQLAELQHKDAPAIAAFQRLIDSEKAVVGDYDALIRLLSSGAPLDAAQLAVLAWHRFDEPRHLIQALTLYAGRNRWTEIGALFRELDSSATATRRSLRQLQQLPEFLQLTGAYQQNTGQLPKARRSFEAALNLAPDSADLQQALLWVLIDGNDTVALRKLLATHELTWQQNPAMHDALAASYLALSLPQVALQRYLTPRIADHQDDFLWLMNYADALDQNQQADRAWRLRRQLLSQEWQAAHGGKGLAKARKHWLTDEGLDQSQRIARTRLLLTQRKGDTGLDALRELLRLDRREREGFSNAAAEIAIGWLQDHAEYTAVRGFLHHQYARSRSSRSNRPLWAEIAVALAEDDKPAVGQLLETYNEGLSRYDRVNAARTVGDVRLAQTAAFETQTDQTDDDPTHLQLTEALLAFSDHSGFAIGTRNLGSMDETPLAIRQHIAVDPRFSLDFAWGQIERNALDDNVVRNLPTEDVLSAKVKWQQPDGKTTLLAEKRKSFDTYTPLLLEHEQRIDNRLSLYFALGSQLPTQASLPLRVAGMKDEAMLGIRYRPTRMDRLVIEHSQENYALQSGGKLGSGSQTAVTLAHTYRQEARDLEFSAFWTNNQFERKPELSGFSQKDLGVLRYFPDNFTPGPGFFLPDSFNFYGLRVSTDMRHEEEYTRAIRPFASLASTWHSQLGGGYDIRLGVAGSVLGADHFALNWGIAKSGMQTSGLTRELLFTYRIHY
jgi:polysaccharide biosynthesis protein PelB